MALREIGAVRRGSIDVLVKRSLLNKLPPSQHEMTCIQMMRRAGIPINGSHKITGLRYGYLHADQTATRDLVFTWHRRDPRTPEQKQTSGGADLYPEQV